MNSVEVPQNCPISALGDGAFFIVLSLLQLNTSGRVNLKVSKYSQNHGSNAPLQVEVFAD